MTESSFQALLYRVILCNPTFTMPVCFISCATPCVTIILVASGRRGIPRELQACHKRPRAYYKSSTTSCIYHNSLCLPQFFLSHSAIFSLSPCACAHEYPRSDLRHWALKRLLGRLDPDATARVSASECRPPIRKRPIQSGPQAISLRLQFTSSLLVHRLSRNEGVFSSALQGDHGGCAPGLE